MEAVISRNETEKRIIVKASLWTMALNAFLAVLKILAGIFGRSAAILSDAVNSVSDVATGLAVMIFGKMSRKERDSDHPYGHEKYESMVSVFLGVALLLTAFEIGKGTVLDIWGHLTSGTALDSNPNWIALVAAGLTIVIKETMCRVTIHYAKKANSPALAALAQDHRSDVFAASGVLIGIGGSLLGIAVFDPIASLIICGLIFIEGIKIIITGINQVVDKAADPETVQAIRDLVSTHLDVKHLDDLKTRVFGMRLFVDMEIAVDPRLTIGQAHHIAHLLHDDIETKFPDVKHCMIHVNPFKTMEID